MCVYWIPSYTGISGVSIKHTNVHVHVTVDMAMHCCTRNAEWRFNGICNSMAHLVLYGEEGGEKGKPTDLRESERR